jgi:hypothetical protein
MRSLPPRPERATPPERSGKQSLQTEAADARPIPASSPSASELKDRAYAIVAAASPVRPTRKRVEWLVGEHERAAHAIDALLAGGLLKETEGGKQLMLSEQRRGVQLLSAKPPGARGEDMPPRTQS